MSKARAPAFAWMSETGAESTGWRNLRRDLSTSG